MNNSDKRKFANDLMHYFIQIYTVQSRIQNSVEHLR